MSSSSLSNSQFSKLHADLMDPNEGGFSINTRTGQSPTAGYMVGVPGYEQQVPSSEVTPQHLKDYATSHRSRLSERGAHFGGWNDSDSGQVSLDVSENITGKASVEREYGTDVADADAYTTTQDLAIARNQEAAYDIRRGKDTKRNPAFDASRRSE
jgi:hypothetical protein